MKKLIIIMALLLANTMFALPFVKVNAEGKFSNKYIWRGVELDDSFVFQPYLGVSAFGAEASVWSNVTTDPAKDMDYLNKTDYTIAYTQSMGLIDVKPSFTYFQMLNKDVDDSAEFGLEFSYTLLWFKAYTAHYLNMLNFTGDYYGTAGAKFTFDLIPMISLEADANIAWAKAAEKKNFLVASKTDFSMNSLNISAQVKFSPVPLFYIGVYGAMTQKLGIYADFAEAADQDKTTIYGGISLGLSL